VLLRDVRAARKRGRSTRTAAKDFHIPFSYFGNKMQRVRQAYVKSTIPTLSLNRGHIQHKVHPPGCFIFYTAVSIFPSLHKMLCV
jgi:hypothetical protein